MRERTRAPLAVLLTTALAAGCASVLRMNEPPVVVPSPDAPIECSEGRASPIGDLALAALTGGIALSLAGTPACETAPPDVACMPGGTPKAALSLSLAGVAVANLLSAWDGHVGARRCGRMKEANRACIAGDPRACEALSPGWGPRLEGAPPVTGSRDAPPSAQSGRAP